MLGRLLSTRSLRLDNAESNFVSLFVCFFPSLSAVDDYNDFLGGAMKIIYVDTGVQIQVM